jgi:hypothetical protein
MGPIGLVKVATSLRIELNASRLAAAAAFVATVATAALVAWLPGNPWLRGAAVVALGAYGIALERTWARQAARRAILAFILRPDLTVTLVERGGDRSEGVLLDDSFVGALLTTLVVRVPPARWPRTIAILPDMLPAEEFRRLRVQLRLGRSAVEPPDATAAARGSAPSGAAARPARR